MKITRSHSHIYAYAAINMPSSHHQDTSKFLKARALSTSSAVRKVLIEWRMHFIDSCTIQKWGWGIKLRTKIKKNENWGKGGMHKYLHDFANAILEIGSESDGNIGGQVGDANALCDYLNCLLWNRTHLSFNLHKLLNQGNMFREQRA